MSFETSTIPVVLRGRPWEKRPGPGHRFLVIWATAVNSTDATITGLNAASMPVVTSPRGAPAVFLQSSGEGGSGVVGRRHGGVGPPYASIGPHGRLSLVVIYDLVGVEQYNVTWEVAPNRTASLGLP